jgi:hypothetical protein
LAGFQDTGYASLQSESFQTLFNPENNFAVDNLQVNPDFENGHVVANSDQDDIVYGFDNSQGAVADTTLAAQTDFTGLGDVFGMVAYPDGEAIFPGAGTGL